VLELRAKDTTGFPVGAINKQNINANGKPGNDRYEITYFPRMRHHRVRVLYNDPNRAPRTFYIPESWVAYEVTEERN
jgi:hypothetical protein